MNVESLSLQEGRSSYMVRGLYVLDGRPLLTFVRKALLVPDTFRRDDQLCRVYLQSGNQLRVCFSLLSMKVKHVLKVLAAIGFSSFLSCEVSLTVAYSEASPPRRMVFQGAWPLVQTSLIASRPFSHAAASNTLHKSPSGRRLHARLLL